MLRLKSKIVTFSIALLVWVLLTATLEPVSLIAGMIVAFLVMLSSADFFTDYPNKWFEPKRYFYFFKFLAIFLWECILANFDVAFRVMQPKMPINPGIVKVKTRLKTEMALTALANSITLTPGTFTVDIDQEKGFLYIHWISVKDKDMVKATNIIVKRFEDIIAKVFE